MASNRSAFIGMLMPHALAASKRTGIDPRIIVAQAAQETGWGRKAPGNNYFGIKSHGKGGGQTFTTHEVINGRRVKMRDSFRRYNSPGDSVQGYADFMLNNKRYAPMRNAQGLDAQLMALGRSGYATDPKYAQSVGAIARSIPANGQFVMQAQPAKPQFDQAQLDFMKNNPQPGGYGNAEPNSAAPSTGPANGVPSVPPPIPNGFAGIPPEVAQYAISPDNEPNMMQRLGEALSQAEGGAPRGASGAVGFRGGSGPGNQLLNYLNSPAMKDILMRKRISHV